MEAIKISVVLCTYNGAKYIEKQIQSILNQTYKNIELLICDDLSTDNTFDIVKEFAERHSNIRCYRNSKNIGFNRNFERAIQLASGEYIAISDQDDIWNPLKLTKLFANIGKNWLIFSNSSFINNQDILTGGQLLNSFDLNDRTYKTILLANFVTGHTTLFKRTFLQYCLPFPPIKYYDWWMGFIALYHSKITFLNESLTYYRVHSQSVIQSQVINIIKDKEYKSKIEFDTVCNQLRYFQKYPNLRTKDRVFIRKLREAYIKRKNKHMLSLLRILLFTKVQLALLSHFKNNKFITAFHHYKG